MAAFKPYGKPPPFDLEEYKDSFELWEKQWEVFLALSTIDSTLAAADRPAYKRNILLSCLSKETLQTLLNMGLTTAEMENVATIIKKLKGRCNAGRNRHVFRRQFALRVQRPGEGIDNWLCDVRDLAKKCSFLDDCCNKCEATRILGQLVHGVADDENRRKLLEVGDNLTLDDAVKIIRAAENAHQQASDLRGASSIQGISTPKSQKNKNHAKSNKPKEKTGSSSSKPGPKSSTDSDKEGCWNCGNKNRHPKSECPAKGQECTKCKRKGHFSRVCRSESAEKAAVGSIQLKRPGASVATVATMKEEHVQLVITAPGVGGKRVISNPDTGAKIDCIPEAMFLEEFASVKLAMGVPTIQASEAIIENVGCFEAEITWKPTNAKSRSVQIVCHVLRGLRQPALSRQTQFRLGMLHPGYPHVAVQELSISNRSDPAASGAAQESPAVLFLNLLAQPERVVAALTTSELTNQQREEDLRNIMNEFPEVFDGVCRTMVGPPCRFVLKEGAEPFAIRGSRPVPEPLMPQLKLELDQLEAQGIIRRVTEPTYWVHPIVIVPKKSGGIRLCVDFRKLNKCIFRPQF